MIFLVSVFFVGAFSVAIAAIVGTVAPRWQYIMALVTNATAQPALAVAQRRTVRRSSPVFGSPLFRPELSVAA